MNKIKILIPYLFFENKNYVKANSHPLVKDGDPVLRVGVVSAGSGTLRVSHEVDTL
jgi:hypothetical protein